MGLVYSLPLGGRVLGGSHRDGTGWYGASTEYPWRRHGLIHTIAGAWSDFAGNRFIENQVPQQIKREEAVSLL
jgi:hypothetical protein